MAWNYNLCAVRDPARVPHTHGLLAGVWPMTRDPERAARSAATEKYFPGTISHKCYSEGFKDGYEKTLSAGVLERVKHLEAELRFLATPPAHGLQEDLIVRELRARARRALEAK